MRKTLIIASILLLSPFAAAQTGLTLYDGADFDANNNSIQNLSELNPQGSDLVVNASSSDFSNNSLENVSNINDFFSSACNTGKVIDQVYSNGSYSCVDPGESVQAEGLNETLAAGNYASGTDILLNGSADINFSQNNALDVGEVRFDESIEIGDSDTFTNISADLALGDGAEARGIETSTVTFTYTGSFASPDITAGSFGQAMALGVTANATDGGTAVGIDSQARGKDSLALGTSIASKQDSTAIGTFSKATGSRATTLGSSASASSEGAVAIGYEAKSPKSYEATFGNLDDDELDVNVTGNLTVHGSNLTFAGDESTIDNFFEQSGCADDEAIKTVYPNGSYLCTDIVNESLQTENLSETLAAGNVANQTISFENNEIRIGSSPKTGIQGDIAIGINAEARGFDDLVAELYPKNLATVGNAIAIGISANASEDGLAIGQFSESKGEKSVALGSAYAGEKYGIAIGTGAVSEAENAIAIGGSRYDTAFASGKNSIGIGSTAYSSGTSSIGLGDNANASASGAVAIGNNSIAPNQNEATFGNLNGEELDVNVTGNLTLHGRNLTFANAASNTDTRIRNFFDQSKCGSDEAIKTVYPNGSYACNQLSTTTQAENLSETLAAGNLANQSINLSGNNITDVNTIDFQDAGGEILNVDQLSLSEGNSNFRLRVGGEKFLDDGFEDGDLDPFFNASGNDQDWSISDSSRYGDHSAVSPDVTKNQVSTLSLDVSQGDRVTFRYKFETGDILADNAFLETSGFSERIPGTDGQWRSAGFDLPAGSKTLNWTLKGGDFTVSGNKMKIDNVKVFNTTKDAISVYGSQTMNTGDLRDVDKLKMVQGINIGYDTSATTGSISIGRNSSANSRKGTAVGQDTYVGDSQSSAFGWKAEASGLASSSFGYKSQAKADSSSALGYESEASGVSATALGKKSEATAGASTALGRRSDATADSATAIGDYSQASSNGAITIGSFAGQGSVEGDSAIVIGGDPDNFGSNGAEATGDYSVTLGPDAVASSTGAVAIGDDSVADESYTVELGSSSQNYDLNINGGSLAVGGNSQTGLSSGDINASTIYYDTSTAKSPVVQCSQGSSWCEVSIPENQSSFFVKKGDSFDKDRPRETAKEVVETDVETVEELEELREENERQEKKIEKLNETVQGLKSVVCEDSPEVEVCR